MTLIPYQPVELDRLALRILDLSADVRRMAQRSREHEVDAVALHGNKIQDWLMRLESWTHDAKARTEAEVNKQLGARRARELLSSTSARKSRRKKS